ncbi:nonribosomal peptide synthase [Aspergillus pseudoviridinutans]|uniref:Nonribosomal peptide synthase n=1 Tax=Aspergillus pseudoviridinutans TaxID=1517512 RepID=A0A9P3ETC4_9EURO|nr:nonribosomal peptide synthase [Aspergillus pseudoviridinutans]GIJ84908.1 nonribosomal peptide synthase [Aspergillus pseudoviridinutans]
MYLTTGHAQVDSDGFPSISSLNDPIPPTLSTSIALPVHLHLLAKAYGIPESDIVQLAWALALRSVWGILSIRWSTVNCPKQAIDQSAHTAQWEYLELDEHQAISWVLRQWQDPFVHRYLSPDELREDKHQIPTTVMAVVEEYSFLQTLAPIGSEMGIGMCFHPSTEQPWLRVIWNPEGMLASSAFRLTRALETALHAIFLTPHVKVGDLTLFSIWDHQQILQWNSHYPQATDRLVHEMFKDVVDASPQANAVAAWDGELTYRELDRLSSRLSGRLQDEFGVQPETIVVLCFEKSVWAIVAMLAVVKAGGAFLHVDPQHPAVRHQAMVQTTAAQLVLCSARTRSIISRSVPECTSMVIDRRAFSVEPDHAQHEPLISFQNPSPRNAAYVVCTSGSTGTPKAIVVEHASLSTSVDAQANAMEISPGSRVLQYAAYTFDVSVGDIFTALTHGACICIPSDWERSHDIAGAINRLDVNQACLTSTVASILSPAEVPGLEKLTLGGEPATPQCVDIWAGHVRLKNVYGPAECTVWCMIQPEVSRHISVSNIGHGIGARAWIVHPEDHDRLMPIGAVGELLIEGPLVARGYLNDSTRTDAVFLSQPPRWLESFGPTPSRSRFYKTGDLARYGPAGALLFEGRKDTQIKLRGQRIELSEIEYRLHRALSDQVAVAVELAHPKGSTAPVLAAFITWGQGIDLQKVQNLTHDARQQFEELVAQIKAEIEQALPPYMIPGLFIPVQTLPLTTSGKLDRKSLRHFCSQCSHEFLKKLDDPNPDAAPKESANPAEENLVRLWAQVLERKSESIRRNDNFLSLGGDSLAAMRLVNLAARDLRLTLTVTDVFNSPILADQANLLRPLVQAKHIAPFDLVIDGDLPIQDLVDSVAKQCELTSDQVEDVYPCTPYQEEMIRDSLYGTRTQTGQEVIQLARDLDLSRYMSACARVFQRCPILRTRFVETSGKLLQVVIREDLPWQRPTSLAAYLEADNQEPPSLGKPLARWALTLDGTHLILTMHHAVFDGISLGQIFGAIYAVYQSIPLPPVNLTFATFVGKIYQPHNDLSDASKRFWRSYLSPTTGSNDVPLLDVEPAGRPCASSGTQRLVIFQAGAVTALQQHGLTEATLARAAWACTLARHRKSPNSDVIFGTILTGRNIHLPGVDELAAPTLAHAPIRVRMSAAQQEKPAHFLARVQADATAMIPFEHDGMDRIRAIDEQVRVACDTMRTLLVIQPIPEGLNLDSTSPFPGPILSGPRVEAREMRHFHWYGLLMECTLLPMDGFFVRMSFDDTLYSPEAAERLLDDYSRTLHELAHGLTEGEPHVD